RCSGRLRATPRCSNACLRIFRVVDRAIGFQHPGSVAVQAVLTIHQGGKVDKTLAMLLMAAAMCLVGCSTSSRVVVNPGSTLVAKSAYVVLHGGNSEDMDAHMQRELMAHGLTIKAGPEVDNPGTDLIVRYADSWRWDMT